MLAKKLKFFWMASLAVVLLLGAVSPTVPAQASSMGATITVNTTADELTIDGNCSLREAIRAANTDAAVDACPAGKGADLIYLPAGNYVLSISGVDPEQALTGDLDITADVNIIGSSANTVVIDGNSLDRVFHVTGSSIKVKLAGLTIQNGYASSESLYGGGGILNQGGSLTLADSIVQNNRAISGHGGGLDNVGTADITNSTFTNNQAETGGGIFNGGTVVLTGVTANGNTATTTGGALDNYYDATLTSVTLSGNTAGSGSGIFSDGTMTVLNSTIAGSIDNAGTARFKNTMLVNSTSGVNCVGVGSFVSLGNNLDSGDTCHFHLAGDLVNVDPLLGLLADNKGPTLTHALLSGSPAIDTGSNTDCPKTDQRGAFRPADGNDDGIKTCDIGAFEYNGVFPSPIFLPVIFR